MAHYKTVNKWLQDVREAANVLERVQSDVLSAGQPPLESIPSAKDGIECVLLEIRSRGASGVRGGSSV